MNVVVYYNDSSISATDGVNRVVVDPAGMEYFCEGFITADLSSIVKISVNGEVIYETDKERENSVEKSSDA